MKKCTKCLKRKPFDSFYPCKKVKSGLMATCKDCQKRSAKGHYIRRHVPVDIREAYFQETGIKKSELDNFSGFTHREVLELFGVILRMENKLKVA